MDTGLSKNNWQPIETLPVDQYVDVWVKSRHNPDFGQRLTDVCKSTEHSSGWIGVQKWLIPTHWMPLPQPPM